MLPISLVFAAVSCMAFGGVGAFPQHRFAFPSSFSFRTVHVPVQPFTRPSRLTVPATPEVSHIPVMVSVPQSFVGDSVVVKSEDLSRLGITSPVDDAPVPEETAAQESVVQMADESPIAEVPLSQLDDSFVLTDSGTEVTEPLDVKQTEPVEPIPEIENQFEVEQPVDTLIIQERSSTISPFETDTFHAYNDFLNTWLKLASVNLNRPDLLRLINVRPTTPAPVVSIAETIPAVVPEKLIETEALPLDEAEIVTPQIAASSTLPPQTPEIMEPVIEEEIAEPVVTEVVQPIPAEGIEEVNPIAIEDAVPALTDDIITIDEPAVTEIVDVRNAEFTTEEPVVLDSVTEIQPQMEIIEETLMDSDKVLPVEEINVPAEVAPVEIDVATEVITSVKKAESVADLAPGPNVLPELTPEILHTNSIAKSINTQSIQPENNFAHIPGQSNLKPIPRFTSRGRFSGFRYSFSHVPQRGTFFLNNQAG